MCRHAVLIAAAFGKSMMSRLRVDSIVLSVCREVMVESRLTTAELAFCF